MLRATASSQTETIDPHGHPSADGLAIGETGHLVVSYGHRSGMTLGARAAVLGPISAGLTVVVLIALWWRARKTRNETNPSEYTRRDSNPQPSVPKTDALSS